MIAIRTGCNALGLSFKDMEKQNWTTRGRTKSRSSFIREESGRFSLPPTSYGGVGVLSANLKGWKLFVRELQSAVRSNWVLVALRRNDLYISLVRNNLLSKAIIFRKTYRLSPNMENDSITPSREFLYSINTWNNSNKITRGITSLAWHRESPWSTRRTHSPNYYKERFTRLTPGLSLSALSYETIQKCHTLIIMENPSIHIKLMVMCSQEWFWESSTWSHEYRVYWKHISLI